MRYADNNCTYTEDATHYVYTGPCVMTGIDYTVRVPKDELFAYRQGKLAQDAFKSLSANDREFLISGVSPEAWGDMFPESA